jgi:hypothetical protein
LVRASLAADEGRGIGAEGVDVTGEVAVLIFINKGVRT